MAMLKKAEEENAEEEEDIHVEKRYDKRGRPGSPWAQH